MGRPQPQSRPPSGGRAADTGDRGLQRCPWRPSPTRSGPSTNPCPRGMGDVHRLARGGASDTVKLPLHPRSGHDPHRRLRPPLLRREDVERLSESTSSSRWTAGATKNAILTMRHGVVHARRAVRHPASPGRAVPGGRRAGSASTIWKPGRRSPAPGSARGTRSCCAGAAGRARDALGPFDTGAESAGLDKHR